VAIRNHSGIEPVTELEFWKPGSAQKLCMVFLDTPHANASGSAERLLYD
jgi:hypothetical protein